MACVGIVGGLGVGATVHYYERLTAIARARGFVPDLLITHVDVDHAQSRIRAGDLDGLAEYLAGAVERLERAGAVAAAFPAVTPHLVIDRVRARTRVPMIDIMHAIHAELAARAIRRVALFGSVFTVRGALWGQVPDVEIVTPRPDEIDRIGRIYQRLLDERRAEPEDTAALRALAAELLRRERVEAILLAGTDLTLMFDEDTAGFPAIDVARPHLAAIAERLAG